MMQTSGYYSNLHAVMPKNSLKETYRHYWNSKCFKTLSKQTKEQSANFIFNNISIKQGGTKERPKVLEKSTFVENNSPKLEKTNEGKEAVNPDTNQPQTGRELSRKERAKARKQEVKNENPKTPEHASKDDLQVPVIEAVDTTNILTIETQNQTPIPVDENQPVQEETTQAY